MTAPRTVAPSNAARVRFLREEAAEARRRSSVDVGITTTGVLVPEGERYSAEGYRPTLQLSPLTPFEQLTASSGHVGKPALRSLPGRSRPAFDAAAAALLRACPRPVVVYWRRMDLVTGRRLEAERIELPCGTKQCPYCSVELRKRYVGHFVSQFKQLPHLRFCTMTVDQTWLTDHGFRADESRKYLAHCFELLRKRLARAYAGFRYVASFEEHASGFYHMHALFSIPMESPDLRRHFFDSGFGCVADVQTLSDALDAGGVEADELARKVGYILAYACKDAGKVRGRRAILASQGFGYHSEAAKAERAGYVAVAMSGEETEEARELVRVAAVERFKRRNFDNLVRAFERRAQATQERARRESEVQRLLAAAPLAAGAVARPAVAQLVALGRKIVAVNLGMVEGKAVQESEFYGARPASDDDADDKSDWHVLGDTITAEDRARFRALDRTAVRMEYWDSARRDGTLYAYRHVYDRANGNAYSCTEHPIEDAPHRVQRRAKLPELHG